MATDLTERLMPLLNFTPDDLTANRDGQLSGRQAERLRGMRQRALWVGIGVILLVSVIAALALYLGQRNAVTILTFIGIAISICNAAIAGVLMRNWLRLNADLQSGAVAAQTGEVQHTVRVAGRAASYVVKLGDVEFSVSKPVFLALQTGARYRFYSTPISRVLLAAEAL